MGRVYGTSRAEARWRLARAVHDSATAKPGSERETTLSLPVQLQERHALSGEREAELGVSVLGLQLGVVGGRRESARFFQQTNLLGGGLLRRAEDLPGRESVRVEVVDERAGLLGFTCGGVFESEREGSIGAGEVVVVVMPGEEGDALAIACGEGGDVGFAADAGGFAWEGFGWLRLGLVGVLGFLGSVGWFPLL